MAGEQNRSGGVMDQEQKKAQMELVFNAFRQEPKTMLQVSAETGIMRSNITRYVAWFRKRNKITEVERGTCPISKHRAVFLSTDPRHIHPDPQASLFQQKNPFPD